MTSMGGDTMRLLHVIDSLVPAGAERSLLMLASRQAAEGHRVEVAYLHDRPGLQAEFEAASVPVHCLAGAGGRLGWTRRCSELIGRLRPDIVHTSLFEADLVGRVAGRARGITVVSSLTSTSYDVVHRNLPGLRRWKVGAAQVADVLTARLTSRLHAVAADVADNMADRLRYPRERIDVVPRGRDAAALGRRDPDRRARARASLGLPAGTPVVLAVARHEHVKGIDVLLDAMPEIIATRPDARLLVAGKHGSASPELQASAERLGVTGSVEFLGPRDDVAELMCAADAFALPSRREGSPGALIEAMALELPAVASDLPTIREVAPGGTVLRVEAGNPAALACGLLATLNDPAAARAQASAARDVFVDRFTMDAVYEGMQRFYGRARSPRP